MKPSSSYVDWMMAPEREAFRRRLNEEWLKAGIDVSDACIGSGGTLGHVIRMPAPDIHGSHRTSWMVVFPAGTGTFRTAYADVVSLANDWQWLPDLGQLLAAIRHLPDLEWFEAEAFDGGARWEFRGGVEGGIGHAGNDKEPEIAAASLLAKLWLTE